MNILRRVSTTRLILAVILIAAASAVTAYAVTNRSGPRPPARPLAVALQRALAARPVPGVTARIAFTNHLFPSGALGGSSSPLLTGADGRLWAGDGRVRLELEAPTGDTEIGWDGRTLVVYDVSSNTVYRVPAEHRPQPAAGTAHQTPSVAELRQAIAHLQQRVILTGAIPGDVAGQPSYSVRVSPRHAGGLLGAVQLGWDANHGVPLKVAVYSRGDPAPVLALAATDISFGAVPASDLTVRTAPGARIVTVRAPTAPSRNGTSEAGSQAAGVAAVARAVPFALRAPDALVGLPREAVRLVDSGQEPAALLVYGRGLGAIAVIEQRAAAGGSSPLASLPAISVDGATGHELATALGTAVQFDRGGVRYSLIGSLPPAAAEAAARTLAR